MEIGPWDVLAGGLWVETEVEIRYRHDFLLGQVLQDQ